MSFCSLRLRNHCSLKDTLLRLPSLPVGASSGVSLGGLSGKTVGGILHRKNWLIEDEQILDVSSDFLE